MRSTGGLRVWLRQASTTERVATAVTMAVVVAVLAWGLVPAPHDGPAELLGAGARPTADEGSGSSAGTPLPDGGETGRNSTMSRLTII